MYMRLFVVLTISWLAHVSSYAADDFDSTYNNLVSCPSDGIPVCSITQNKQYVIFPNECLLQKVNKYSLLDIKKIPLKQCIYGCHLNCPKKYKPICSKNLITHDKKMFFNLCEATKYACKTNTSYVKLNLEECKTRIVWNHSNKLIEKRSKPQKWRPIPCTNVFKPICASYLGVKSTFRNECLLNAENVKYNRDWRIVKKGICAEDYSNAQQNEAMTSKPHPTKKRSYDENNFEKEYDANNFVDFKSDSHLPNNGVYVYMPTAFQTQFLDHSYQHVANAFNDIFKKFISEEENIPKHKNLAYGEIQNKPMLSFTPNRMNFRNIPNDNSMNDHIATPKPSGINVFPNTNSNDDYFYTFEKVQPSPTTLNMAFVKPSPETEQVTYEKNEPIHETERMNFENIDSNHERKQATAKPFSIATAITQITTTKVPTTKTTTTTTSQPEAPKKIKLLREEKNLKKIQDCKFGSLPICAVLPNGTVQTFDSVCEMMTTNIYLKNIWTKLHEGECGRCKYNCTRDYQPICVTRNGVNYTMVNDCYFNLGICMDNKSIWKKIANTECELYTHIPDKYENSKHGFSYTSNYFVSTEKTTHMTSLVANPITMTSTFVSSTALPLPKDTVNTNGIIVPTNKPLRSKSRKSKIRKSFSNRVVNSSASKKSSKDVTVTTLRPTTRLSLYGPHTNSYIMRLVNEKVNQKPLHN